MATGGKQIDAVDLVDPPVECFIDKREVGRRLKAGVRTVELWMGQGVLPYYKIGTSVRFKWSDVERHLDTHCRVSTSATSPLP